MSLEKWLVVPGQSKVIDLAVVRRLKVTLIGGKVDIVGHDEPGARVEVHAVSGKELRISMDGDSLEIDHPQLRWDNFIDVFSSFRGSAKADISVMVPRDVAVKLGVVSAEALVSNLTAGARLSTVSGDIVVDGVSGPLDLNGVNGEFSVRDHTGSVSVHTVTGETTASGRIDRFTLDGVSGDVFLDLAGTPDAVNTNTVNGNVMLRLGSDVPARYLLNTVSGTLQVDDHTIRRSFGKGYEGSFGDLAGSWLELRANSVSGDISVVRQRSTTQAGATDAPSEASA
jgi:DUF4097 and DUF4098 domain-containing protein YvlB